MVMNKDSFNICTYNCNGLNNSGKRKDVFDFLRKKKAHIYCLQETHLLCKNENFIRTNWGYNVWLSGTDSNKNGVAILFNNNFEYKLIDVIRDPEGCYIIMNLEILKIKLTLVNLYGPSSGDNPDFFEKILEIITNIGNEHVIMAGDWNCFLNPELDVRNYADTARRPRTRRKINEIMTQHSFIDIFREIYPDKRLYTWRKFNSAKQARLDYFLTSDQLSAKINNISIEPGHRSDHSVVSLSLKKEEFKRDRPFWKFNNSLLKDKKYIEQIKTVITEVKKQYAIPVYDFENINNISPNDLTLQISDQLFFETLLLEIRGKTISYSTFKKREDTKRETELENDINQLESNLQTDDVVLLENLKTELQELRDKKVQGMSIRSKAHWIYKGEKVNRYFCNMEKRNYLDKTMPYLEKGEDTILTDQASILKEVQSYYEKLYSAQIITASDLELVDSLDAPVLTEEDSKSIEGLVTLEEAATALKNMKNFKSPGPDGFTVEFFKFFFCDLGIFLVRSINEGFLKGKLSVTQRQGTITCIPKEGKSKRLIKNWRPISLLNVSYKIASSCIANRIKSVLDEIIHESQKGFLKGRYIGENIRLIYDALIYTEKKDIPGLLLAIDFEKAFDSVSWVFLQKCLKFFHFGPDIIKWIETFYTNISSCVYVNGQYSSWFAIKRGVRQGDPASPYLYLICAEILSIMMRSNSNIRGLTLKDKTTLISQFADDTSLLLDGSEQSFTEAVSVLNVFARMSGLKINFDKSQAVWLGREKNCGIQFMREQNFVWDPGSFKILGIRFSVNTNTIVKLNYEDKLNSMKRIMNVWKKRQLTPFGKITVIKTLVISKIVYLLTNLPDPPDDFIVSLENEIYRFLWNEKQNKIKKNNY